MKKKIVSGLLVVALGVIVLTGLRLFIWGEKIADIRFPEKNWSPALLVMKDQGPFHIPKSSVFTVKPYPENDSPTTQGELEYLRRVTSERTEEQTADIIGETSEVISPLFNVIGLDIPTHPSTLVLIGDAVNEVTFFILREKWRYQRARPTQLAPDLSLAIPIPPHASYPSGHGGQSHMAALVMAELLPDLKPQLIAWADKVGRNREIAGVHYPSDTRAGQALAEQVFAAYRQTPHFQKGLLNAQAELITFEPDTRKLESYVGTLEKPKSFP